MEFSSFAAVGRMYIIARRIVLGIVFLAAAGVGVTVYRLQHEPVYQNHRYESAMLDGLRSGSQVRGWTRAA